MFVKAAQTSRTQPGYRFQMTTDERIGANNVVVSGSGTYAAKEDAGAFRLSFAGATVQRSTEQEIYRDGNAYVKMAGDSGGDSGKWVVVTLADAARLGGDGGARSLVSVANAGRSPSGMFDYLDGETEGVTNLGSATVAGVATTHYSATLDVTKVLAEIESSNAGSMGAELSQILARTNTAAVPVQVWIDGSNLVRKLVVSGSTKVAAVGTVHVTTTLLFAHYGSQPAPSAPPASQTISLASLLKAAG